MGGSYLFERVSRDNHAQDASFVIAAGVGEVAQVAIVGAGVEELQCDAHDREVADDVGVAAAGLVLEQRAVAAVVVARLDPPVVTDVCRPLACGARACVQRAEVPGGFAGGLAGFDDRTRPLRLEKRLDAEEAGGPVEAPADRQARLLPRESRTKQSALGGRPLGTFWPDSQTSSVPLLAVHPSPPASACLPSSASRPCSGTHPRNS